MRNGDEGELERRDPSLHTGPPCPSDRQPTMDAEGRAERQTHGRST